MRVNFGDFFVFNFIINTKNLIFLLLSPIQFFLFSTKKKCIYLLLACFVCKLKFMMAIKPFINFRINKTKIGGPICEIDLLI